MTNSIVINVVIVVALLVAVFGGSFSAEHGSEKCTYSFGCTSLSSYGYGVNCQPVGDIK